MRSFLLTTLSPSRGIVQLATLSREPSTLDVASSISERRIETGANAHVFTTQNLRFTPLQASIIKFHTSYWPNPLLRDNFPLETFFTVMLFINVKSLVNSASRKSGIPGKQTAHKTA